MWGLATKRDVIKVLLSRAIALGHLVDKPGRLSVL